MLKFIKNKFVTTENCEITTTALYYVTREYRKENIKTHAIVVFNEEIYRRNHRNKKENKIDSIVKD